MQILASIYTNKIVYICTLSHRLVFVLCMRASWPLRPIHQHQTSDQPHKNASGCNCVCIEKISFSIAANRCMFEEYMKGFVGAQPLPHVCVCVCDVIK